ncbi:MAG: HPr family phosphocarrier protein [Vallitalea sp.]|jgi:phosphocarrier protein|nr:HPr family phosphocarrier protein [Vallitalea sp.]
MEKFTAEVRNEVGLHARPASVLTKTTSKFKSDITISKDGKDYNAKSIIGILSMGAKKGDTVSLTIEGSDEEKAAEILKSLFEDNFGE